MIDIETVGIGIVMLSPVYGALWYLVILGTANKEKINDLTADFKSLKDRFEACRVCKKAEQ